MQKVYFYLPKGSIFEATEYYVNLIASSFSKDLYQVFFIDNLGVVTSNDYLLTIRPYDAAHLKFKPKKHLHWFQGIAPEERLLNDRSLKARIYSYLFKRWEKKTLKRCDMMFFVSDSMIEHYEKKYSVNLADKSIVMPCYNIKLDSSSFDLPNRYIENTFVYAGGMNEWQCIKETLLIFKGIAKKDEKASLVLLTKDKDLAQKYITELDIPNVRIDFVALNQLQSELKKYKFGFLIRKNHIINNVSTPTKMNSYLAAGVIPIYTPYIDAFERNLDLKEFCVKIQNIEDVDAVVKSIFDFGTQSVNSFILKETYTKVFECFYNDTLYRSYIEEQLTNLE